jgi:CHAD domain-containing protein
MNGVQKAKIDVAIDPDQRADAAAASVLRRLLTVFADNLEGAIVGEDIEYLHQLRIAVRRSRTVQRQLRTVFPATDLPGFRSDFRWLQRATGESRDLDVYVDEFRSLVKLLPDAQRDDVTPMRQVLIERQLAARERLELTLRSRRAAELIDDWERLLESLVELPLEDRPDAAQTIGYVCGQRIAKVYRGIVSSGEKISDASPAEDFHELRKKGKELRYLLELFGVQLFDSNVVEPLVDSLKQLQELLGRHQDREVQVVMVRSLTSEVAPRPGGAAACLAMGTLVARLRDDELAARRAFAESFAELASPAQRDAVTGAFG